MTKESIPKDTPQEQDTEEEPQVYSVKKGLTGWKFSRREFLTAAATAAAATAAAMATGDKSKEATPERIEDSEDSIPLAVAMLAIMAVKPVQSFAQVWRLTNNSDTAWCRGAKLVSVDDAQVQAPTSVPVPDIAPGKTVAVQAEMVAPAEPGTYQSNWRLQAAGNTAPVPLSPLVVSNGCIAESSHPYENNLSQGWTVTNPDENACSTRAHFSQVDLVPGDYIILKDSTGKEHQRITDSYPSGLWSQLVPGSVVQVELVTNDSGTGWGFCLDQLEAICFVYLPLVSKSPTSTPTVTPTRTPTPTHTPCPCYSHCSCNPHCTCDYVHYWYPC